MCSTGKAFGPEMLRGSLELPISIGTLGLGPYLSAGILISIAVKVAKSLKIGPFEYWQENGQDVRLSFPNLGLLLFVLVTNTSVYLHFCRVPILEVTSRLRRQHVNASHC